MIELAINGGKKLRKESFHPQRISQKEIIKEKIGELIDSEVLSGYRGSYSEAFWGGKKVNELESSFEELIDSKQKHKALAVNSCTSALYIACGALGLKAGDEVIVTPWSMTCSASIPILYGAVPVFADIEKDYFCLDPESVEEKITSKTVGIIVVDLFGQPYDVARIKEIAEKYNLWIIEDAAQAIGSVYTENTEGGRIVTKDEEHNRWIVEDATQAKQEDKVCHSAGTLGDIGCFSFTQGKHFTCGEGGMIIAKDKELYYKCALLRNHAEAIVQGMPTEMQEKYKNMVGLNLRMTELQAVVLKEQLTVGHLRQGQIERNVTFLQREICNKIKGITPVKIRKNCSHSYYVLSFLYDSSKMMGIHRDKYIEAVKAELMPDSVRIDRGVPISAGYIEPLYNFPVFEQFNWEKNNSFPRLHKENDFPNVEILQRDKLFLTLYHLLDLEYEELRDVVKAFIKVYENLEELK